MKDPKISAQAIAAARLAYDQRDTAHPVERMVDALTAATPHLTADVLDRLTETFQHSTRMTNRLETLRDEHRASLRERTYGDAPRVTSNPVDGAIALRQIEELAQWIAANVPGEPSRSEGAVATAVRLLGAAYSGGPRVTSGRTARHRLRYLVELARKSDGHADELIAQADRVFGVFPGTTVTCVRTGCSAWAAVNAAGEVGPWVEHVGETGHEHMTAGDLLDKAGAPVTHLVPVGTSVVDVHGDVWTREDDGLMHSPETRPFNFEYVSRKWGPLRQVEAGDVVRNVLERTTAEVELGSIPEAAPRRLMSPEELDQAVAASQTERASQREAQWRNYRAMEAKTGRRVARCTTWPRCEAVVDLNADGDPGTWVEDGKVLPHAHQPKLEDITA